MNLKTQTVEDARRQAKETLADAQKQARSTMKDARKQARRQVVEARIAAARARSGARARASGFSAKAVGAVGVVGLAAGYILAGRTRHEPEYRTGQIENNVDRPADPEGVPGAESLLHTR
jgi:cell division septum initiation protein DivIVA